MEVQKNRNIDFNILEIGRLFWETLYILIFIIYENTHIYIYIYIYIDATYRRIGRLQKMDRHRKKHKKMRKKEIINKPHDSEKDCLLVDNVQLVTRDQLRHLYTPKVYLPALIMRGRPTNRWTGGIIEKFHFQFKKAAARERWLSLTD